MDNKHIFPTYKKIDDARRKLKAHGVDYDSLDGGAHMVIRYNTLTVDFYPATGKFSVQPKRNARPKPTGHLRGVDSLISYLGA